MTIIDGDTMPEKLGLYIHVPFCLKKCLYCDFCSFPSYSNELMDGYVRRLISDIERHSGDFCGVVDTVYFGGGTPTLLKERHFGSIFEAISKNYTVDGGAEISCECNPATVDGKYLGSIRKIGINRLSIGLQSANDCELRALGRAHSFADFLRTYEDARGAGFDNVSLDLMYGIPEQTLDSFCATLAKVREISPEHISAYALKIEDGTPFGRMKETLSLPDEDAECDMYSLCNEALADGGYQRYEISNFARPGFESRHNIKYWQGDDYLGFGVAAHSYFKGERHSNSRDIAAYVRGDDITEERRAIPKKEQMTEYVMLRMRMSDGICRSAFKARFGVSLEEFCGELSRYVSLGLMTDDGERVAFTERGIFVSNTILSDILDFD